MAHHTHDQDGQGEREQSADAGARPDEILRDGAGQGPISDEEAVLAYNANAEDGNPDPDEADE